MKRSLTAILHCGNSNGFRYTHRHYSWSWGMKRWWMTGLHIIQTHTHSLTVIPWTHRLLWNQFSESRVRTALSGSSAVDTSPGSIKRKGDTQDRALWNTFIYSHSLLHVYVFLLNCTPGIILTSWNVPIKPTLTLFETQTRTLVWLTALLTELK